MPCHPVQFDCVSRAQWMNIQSALQASGIPVDGDKGEMKRYGITVRWSYTGETLIAQCVAKPWIISEATINDRIAKEFGRLKKT